jgi:hypothetical protein
VSQVYPALSNEIVGTVRLIVHTGSQGSTQLPGGQGAFQFSDGLCDMDIPWAGFRAIEDGAAAPYPGLFVHDF